MAQLDLEQANVKSVLRIMDVASELRKKREQAEGELNVDDAKAEIREKILATAEITGEQLTPQEIDAAIDSFYGGLYRFEKPERNLQYRLAQLYIARSTLFRRILLPLMLVLAVWYGFQTMGSLRESKHNARIAKQLDILPAQAKKLHTACLAVARDDTARTRANDLFAKVASAEAAQDLKILEELNAKFQKLLDLLRQEYQVVVVNRPGERSGIDRYFSDQRGQRVSGYYLIVEAHDSNGQRIPIEIESKESNSRGEVLTWAERVPKSVYDRIRQDKMKDGTLEEVLFARKELGFTDMTVVMKDQSGNPLNRQAQIASW